MVVIVMYLSLLTGRFLASIIPSNKLKNAILSTHALKIAFFPI